MDLGTMDKDGYTTKTYAEARGKEAFDWRHEILLNMNNPLLATSHPTLTWMAGKWVTCACGNQCSIIPRWPGGQPVDPYLRSFGVDFAKQIIDQEWEKALDTLDMIEIRSQQLIDEIKSQHGTNS